MASDANGPDTGPTDEAESGADTLHGSADERAGRVVVAAGPRRLEALLLGEVCAAIDRAGMAGLARPLRVIVHSRSLRDHLTARLVAMRARPVVGVTFQTLHQVAHEILDRAGELVRPGDLLLPSMVSAFASAEPALRDCVEAYADGDRAIAASVRDLLDAGLDQQSAEAASEWLLDEAQGGAGELARARALVRVAQRVRLEFDAHGLSDRAAMLVRARERLEADAEAMLPARAVWVHGFADATGVVAELLESLVRERGAAVFIDAPPAPADRSQPDPGAAHADRLRQRLEGAAPGGVQPELGLSPEEAPVVETAVAVGSEGEVRTVVARVSERLAAGMRPEGIAIVARRIDDFAVALRRELAAFGVPFSGLGATAPGGAAARRVRALDELFQDGPRASIDSLLELAAPAITRSSAAGGKRRAAAGGSAAREQWRSETRRLGFSRIEQLTASEAPAAQDERRGAPAPLVEYARRVVDVLGAWRRIDRLGAHCECLDDLVTRGLGVDARDPVLSPLLAQLRNRLAEVPRDFELPRGDFFRLVVDLLDAVAREKVGGEGGGVQVLGVMEARARSFDALFVLGLNRDVFPRVVLEDPLLSDRVRLGLSVLLPEVPVKLRGHDEERFLFAQLMDAAPSLHVSWQSQADNGQTLAPSPLLLSLPSAAAATSPVADDEKAGPLWRHFAERALGPSERDWVQLLDERARELRSLGAKPLAAPKQQAQTRMRVLAEIDRAPHPGIELGAFDGFVGPLAVAESARDKGADRRAGTPYVTTLESVARCGWQSVLEKLLQLAPPADPVGALPDLEARHVGTMVHAVLERAGRMALGLAGGEERKLEDLGAQEPVELLLPDAELRDAWLLEAAREALRKNATERGYEAALAALLVARARPYVERAEALLEASDPLVGTEFRGEVVLALPGESEDEALTLRFRADAASRRGEALLLTDYKTGRAPSGSKKKRAADFERDRRSGRKLQAMAYAWAAGERALGRYVHLAPDADPATVELVVDRSSPEWPAQAAAFEASVSTIWRAWQGGVLPPRLFDANGKRPSACDYCDVKQACVAGDSGARGRVAAWLDAHEGSTAASGAFERRFQALWELDGRADGEGAEGAAE